MTKKGTEKAAKRVKPPEFTPPGAGGSYVDGTDLEHRVAHTEPADRHEKLEEANRADAD